ncbi:MAG: glutamate 5-kinase, partial [Clostridia bacterium]|nr:glutamate 5-kinase [Clostridia bacterium]
TDTDGLYTADPRVDPNASLIREVETITPELMSLGGGSGTKQGTGGMSTKLKAASIATEAGIETVIINGKLPQMLYDIVEGNDYTGTRFLGKH